TAHVNGHPVTWPIHGTTTPLPTYAFQHQRYWLDPRSDVGSGAGAGAGTAVGGVLWDAVAAGDEAALAGLLALDPAQQSALSELLPALADWHRAQAPGAQGQQEQLEPQDDAPVPLRDQLAGLPADEVEATLLEAVRQYTADVLGLGDAELIDVRLDFLELGMSSFTALELSKRLSEEGLELDPVAIYDHPTPAALAEHLRGALLTAL
ncbi:phosphopantetheine-binding protein, partial [Streptomyces sp. NPDC050095]|uniref:acyl carrier protein n=1 Tax=unclassified Streptomyces TaxID=2593676 RepID=UPI003412BE65